ncbi:sugar-binding protein [Cohnella sp. REN36]|uniref:sugar-binding protein n=1 Tax=Cohnella sp. REN36 TaxID=2887347 RepID=UPI001D14EB6B|nr:sugar-binding protein [Cohnella sp. REN36]MCC3371904.1 Ig-like domain-containing protein [Cohnella sp. REN36]
MNKRFSMLLYLLLVSALLFQGFPLPASAEEASETLAAPDAPLFADGFESGLGNWDTFGSAAWQVQGSGAEARLAGATAEASPQRAVVKASKFAYTNADYSFSFAAQGDRFRALFRYSSGTSYYFLEFKNENRVELWKYPNASASVQVGTTVDLSTTLADFRLTDVHQYRIVAKGSAFALDVDGVRAAAFTDASLPTGGVGFALKSVGPAVSAAFARVEVRKLDDPAGAIAIRHAPAAEVPYYADLPVLFTVADEGASSVSASVYYAYGDGTPSLALQAASVGSATYSATIPGTNRAGFIRYHIAAQDDAGRTARYPATGEIVVPIGALLPYANDFESDAPNGSPAGWTTGGSARIAKLPDGNQVLRLNGSGSAKLNLPMYQNADNFVVKFKAKYERTSDAVQNTWRLRYRATDDANNNALEWATHNSKYFLMRKTTLGGNYYIANYVQSLLGDWHDYELRVSGIKHRLFIDGAEVASGEDSDALARTKGYFQWNVVGGIDLMVDDFEIAPIALPYVVDLQPAGNYTGIYTTEEAPGLALSLDAGAAAHAFRIDYAVRRADGDKALVVSGTKSYALGADERLSDTLSFAPGLSAVGTYDVSASFAVDGDDQPGLAKAMRFAIASRAAPVGPPDLDNESVFGLNTHYALNWKDDIIDGARKLGARHHRSGIVWETADRNAKDASGTKIYDYTESDALLNKLYGYGFNQITVLGIDKNAYYQNGTVNTAASLQAMGDFVYRTVDRYKGKIRQWEMPNEPEIFSKPYIPEEFVQIQKTAYLNLKKADPDAMLLAGDHTSSVLSVLPKELALGSYDYADAYSFHPYVYNSMPDGSLSKLIGGVKDLVNAYGGWKDYYLTEGGWPTAKAGYPSVSEETQRDYIVRAFLNYMTMDQVKAYEYYNYKNDGTDDRYYDIFWGITDNDGRPKLAYAAVNQLMTELDRARYVGTWDAGDPNVSVEVFLNGARPVVVAWRHVDAKDDPAVKPATSVVSLPFDAAGVTAKDVNGVALPLASANGASPLTVGSAPVYLTGVPASFVRQAAAQLIEAKRAEASAKLERLRTAESGAAVDGDLAELNRIASALGAAAVSPSGAAGLERGIRDSYALMARIAGQIADGTVERAPADVVLEAVYNLAERASVALASALGDASPNGLDYKPAVQAAAAAFAAKKGDDGILPVSAAAVLRMNRYGRLAEAAHARGDYAESYAYNLLAREFAGAVQAIVGSEPVRFAGIRAVVTPIQANGEAGQTRSFTLSLINDTDVPRPIDVLLKLPEGWATTQPPAAETATVPARGSADLPYAVSVPADAANGKYAIGFEVRYAGALIDTVKAQLTVEDGISARVLPVQQPIGELNVVTVELTGTSSADKSGTVAIRGPDGALLEPMTTNVFSVLKKGDKLRLAFRWTDHALAPFNEYPVDLRVEETGGRTIFRDAAMPLDFNLAQRARGVTVDGDLSDWSDAYPFHLRTKFQHASGYHDPDNLEAIAYAKWDADGLYLAVSVTDDIHKQSENAANLWKNDSVQISLDPLLNRESPYGPDDVEWGFALTDAGAQLVQIFQATAPNPNGEASGQTPFAAIRDEAAHRTIYEMKIPSAYVKDLRPALGGRIGLNVAVNDADLQNGRDDFIQWTPGTADAKNTSLYDAFLFVDVPVAATGVAVSPGTLLLRPGEQGVVKATVTPANAADRSVTWSSSDEQVARVAGDGVVRAAAEGTAAIAATTTGGGFRATAEVTVDGTPPTIRYAGPAAVSRLGKGTLVFDVRDALSGIAEAAFALDGHPIANGFAVAPLSLEAGDHRLTAEAADRAGNRSTAEATLRVTFDVGELDDMLNFGYAQGWIRAKDVLQSLLAKAKTIQQESAKDKTKVNYKPLLQEIQEQSGKKIETAFAESLQRDIAYLQRT